jgi:hypothetical protein
MQALKSRYLTRVDHVVLTAKRSSAFHLNDEPTDDSPFRPVTFPETLHCPPGFGVFSEVSYFKIFTSGVQNKISKEN